MAKISKEIDFNTTVVKIKLQLKGNRNIQYINCTASQVMDFVDFLNKNESVVLNKYDKEKMENKYYIFDDILNKKNILVSFRDIKYMEIPFFIDTGKDYDLKILTWN